MPSRSRIFQGVLLVWFLTLLAVKFAYPEWGWWQAFEAASKVVGIWVALTVGGYALLHASLKEW